MEGLADLDGGTIALDLHRLYNIDLTPRLMRTKTWQWLLSRCYSLLDLDSLTRKAVIDDGV